MDKKSDVCFEYAKAAIAGFIKYSNEIIGATVARRWVSDELPTAIMRFLNVDPKTIKGDPRAIGMLVSSLREHGGPNMEMEVGDKGATVTIKECHFMPQAREVKRYCDFLTLAFIEGMFRFLMDNPNVRAEKIKTIAEGAENCVIEIKWGEA